jgi:mono/diheme cytochrome c family protein
MPVTSQTARVLAATAVVGVLTAACGGGSGASSADGAQLFANNCASCHGADLQGTTVGPPLLHEYYVPSHHPDESFMSAIRQGVQAHHWNFGPMAPIPAVNEDEANAIIAYVREQQREAGIID